MTEVLEEKERERERNLGEPTQMLSIQSWPLLVIVRSWSLRNSSSALLCSPYVSLSLLFRIRFETLLVLYPFEKIQDLHLDGKILLPIGLSASAQSIKDRSSEIVGKSFLGNCWAEDELFFSSQISIAAVAS